jgi:hypothetical protein
VKATLGTLYLLYIHVFRSTVSFFLNDKNSTSQCKNAGLTGGKKAYIVMTADSNTMPGPRLTEFNVLSVRSGTVIGATKVDPEVCFGYLI